MACIIDLTPEDLSSLVKILTEEANEIAVFLERPVFRSGESKLPSVVTRALKTEMARLRTLRDKIAPNYPDTDEDEPEEEEEDL